MASLAPTRDERALLFPCGEERPSDDVGADGDDGEIGDADLQLAGGCACCGGARTCIREWTARMANKAHLLRNNVRGPTTVRGG